MVFSFHLFVFILQVALDEEIAEKESENNKVDDLKMKKVAGVAFWKYCNDAMSDDYHELDQLNNCYDRFNAFDELLNLLVGKRAEEVVRVHGDVHV